MIDDIHMSKNTFYHEGALVYWSGFSAETETIGGIFTL